MKGHDEDTLMQRHSGSVQARINHAPPPPAPVRLSRAGAINVLLDRKQPRDCQKEQQQEHRTCALDMPVEKYRSSLCSKSTIVGHAQMSVTRSGISGNSRNASIRWHSSYKKKQQQKKKQKKTNNCSRTISCSPICSRLEAEKKVLHEEPLHPI